jgi:hypothetical protein
MKDTAKMRMADAPSTINIFLCIDSIAQNLNNMSLHYKRCQFMLTIVLSGDIIINFDNQ